MDGLSVLFGILTAIFIVVVFGTSILNSLNGSGPELTLGPVKTEGFAAPSSLQLEIRKVIDELALNTDANGKPITDGADLCRVFVQVRDSMRQSEAVGQSLSDAEITSRVEAQLAVAIPGGALPCPLVKYPSPSMSDNDWLSWLQDIPSDFGTRTILMAAYADKKLTEVAKQLKDALSGDITLPEINEGFAAICTPALAKQKRTAAAAASCKLSDSATPAEIKEAATSILADMVAQRNALKLQKQNDPLLAAAMAVDVHTHVQNALRAMEYLNKQKDAAKSGTLMPSGVPKQMKGKSTSFVDPGTPPPPAGGYILDNLAKMPRLY